MSRMAEGDVLAWEEPPPKKNERWLNIAAALKKRPGVWALVAEDIDSKYADGGVRHSLRRAGCQVAIRNKGGRTMSVWARWPDEA